MSLSSICVVTNALRLKYFKPEKISGVGAGFHASPDNKETNMKTIMIEGMSCGHCSGRVEKALNALPGVTATVSHETKSAQVTGDVSDEVLKKTVEDAGYEVVGIE
jgi:copper chaperone CopZ